MKYKLVEIQKIDTIEVSNETVYDIEVEDDHSYCVDNNIIVHNSNCSTRLKTGVGRPMLSCILECSHAAHGLVNGNESGKLGLICADGGCKISADLCKGFAAGADFMMLGSMFAGTAECEGKWTYEYKTIYGNWQPVPDGSERPEHRKKNLIHYGMSSNTARELHYEGQKKDYIAEEGYETVVPYKGPVYQIVQDILGSVRSCGTYIAASRLKDFSKCAEFVKVNRLK